jgi:hypothetical protein
MSKLKADRLKDVVLKDGKQAYKSMGIWGGLGLIVLGGLQIILGGELKDGIQNIAEGIAIIGLRRAFK